jgi:hypothetical protein
VHGAERHFGTKWEFTPFGSGGNDYVNLSTNAGKGPDTPPPLCGTSGPDTGCGVGTNANDCVTADANIFYNVPIAWSTNRNCSFTSRGKQQKDFQCTDVLCPDAYQSPTDDKQVACTSNTNANHRGYLVTYCPDDHQLP